MINALAIQCLAIQHVQVVATDSQFPTLVLIHAKRSKTIMFHVNRMEYAALPIIHVGLWYEEKGDTWPYFVLINHIIK